MSCTACPLDYVSSPTADDPRHCILPGTTQSAHGVHCGEDSGLGSMWEANLRMPALVRWPGRIGAGRKTDRLVSTLDVVPTILSIAGVNESTIEDLGMDGKDIAGILLGTNAALPHLQDRILFFWRDGFADGPLPAPFGRFDVVAAKVGRIKAWFWTKSGHYNADPEVRHDPPLLFDTVSDPAEGLPLDPAQHGPLIERLVWAVAEHKRGVNWTHPGPLTLDRDARYLPCANRTNRCRTGGSR
jgi:arylsulfatase A-like enzyme